MVYTLIDHTKETLHFIYSIHVFILIGPLIHQANKLYSTGPFRTVSWIFKAKQNYRLARCTVCNATEVKLKMVKAALCRYYTSPVLALSILCCICYSHKYLAGSVSLPRLELLCKTETFCLSHPTDPFQLWSHSDPLGHQFHPSELGWRPPSVASGGWKRHAQPNHNGCFLVHHSLRIVRTGSQYVGMMMMGMILQWMTECT